MTIKDFELRIIDMSIKHHKSLCRSYVFLKFITIAGLLSNAIILYHDHSAFINAIGVGIMATTYLYISVSHSMEKHDLKFEQEKKRRFEIWNDAEKENIKAIAEITQGMYSK